MAEHTDTAPETGGQALDEVVRFTSELIRIDTTNPVSYTHL